MSAPFIRCAGGKRELAPDILRHMPAANAYDTYVEPFLGGGAIFFALWNAHDFLKGKIVLLGDYDKDLINLYAAVRDDVLRLEREAGRMIGAAWKSGDAKIFYEKERALWNKGRRYRTPARHLFIRKACWNGLWRTNRRGLMNTPWRGEAPARLGMELMHAMAALKGTELLDWDFRKYEESDRVFIGPRTLVYLDPPYLGKRDDFVGYTELGWSKKDAIALLQLAAIWHERGAHVVLSNDDNPDFRALVVAHWPAASVHQIFARRSINSDGAKRGKVPELLVVGSVDRVHATCYVEVRGEESRAE